MWGSALRGADHGLGENVGLARRAWRWLKHVFWLAWPQGAATDVSALRVGSDRSRQIARAFQPGMAKCLRSAPAINCTTSSLPGFWDAGPLETELLVQADKLVGGSDAVLVMTTQLSPRRARIRWVSRRNMLQRWARPPTARPWYR